MLAKATASGKKYTYFIGIDISRNELDFAVFKNKEFLFHQETRNRSAAINLFIKELRALPGFKLSKALFCMEQTGMYGNYLLQSLYKAKADIVVENPVRIKNSMGLVRNKDDRIDAIRIGQYTIKYLDDLKLWEPRRPVLVQLANLFSTRTRLLAMSTALKLPLKEQSDFYRPDLQRETVKACKKSIAALQEDFEALEEAIKELINSDARLKRLNQLVTSVHSIGPVTAIQMILCTNEFRDITDPRKFACYAGVAPFKKESGRINGRAKISHAANKRIKSLLHICSMSTLRSDNEFKKYFERKTKIEGKPGMAVINAIRNKLILRIFACVNQDRMYIRDYKRSNEIIADELIDASSLKTY